MTPSNNPAKLFSFEEEEYADLKWMPLTFRYRLDLCGLKLSLVAWQQLPISDRLALLNLGCEEQAERTAWISKLNAALAACGFEGSPGILDSWTDPLEIPADVAEKLLKMGFGDKTRWERLSPMQRYALCKLARSKQGEQNLVLAVKEFVGRGTAP
jgi:hypothetical protein